MSPGRNDPCPCGSGRKYKHCCGMRPPDELAEAGRRIRRLQEDIEPRIFRYSRDVFGESFAEDAWHEFVLEFEDIAPDGPELQLFLPWAIYEWTPELPESLRLEGVPNRLSISEVFLGVHDSALLPAEKQYLLAVSRSPFSFHDVLEVEPGRRLLLRDVLLQTERDVFEQSGSKTLRVGDILYGRVVQFESVALLIGSGSVAFPPIKKEPLLQFRKRMQSQFGKVSPGMIHLGSDQFRRLYLGIREQILNPPPPVLQNTDGEPLEFHTLTWKIGSPDEAFRALAPLAQDVSKEELLGEATLDEAGHVKRVEFPWTKPGNKMHAQWENTILGHIKIEGTTLRIEVNSAKRAKRIQAEVRKRLGRSATGPRIEAMSAEASLREQAQGERSPGGKRRTQEDDEFLQSPEVQEVMRSHAQAHWEHWPHRKIPLLGNKTPLQAIRDPEGREMVEALLLHYESRGERGMASDFNSPKMIDRVRKRLGLKSRTGSRASYPEPP